MAAKYIQHTRSHSPKGLQTTDSKILPLNDEAVVVGRLAVFHRIGGSVRQILSDDSQIQRIGVSHLTNEAQIDEYGLMRWFFRKDGRHLSPFATLQRTRPNQWTHIQDYVPA